MCVCLSELLIHYRESLNPLAPPLPSATLIKAMGDIGVAMTPFGDIETVILVDNSYLSSTQGVGH